MGADAIIADCMGAVAWEPFAQRDVYILSCVSMLLQMGQT